MQGCQRSTWPSLAKGAGCGCVRLREAQQARKALRPCCPPGRGAENKALGKSWSRRLSVCFTPQCLMSARGMSRGKCRHGTSSTSLRRCYAANELLQKPGGVFSLASPGGAVEIPAGELSTRWWWVAVPPPCHHRLRGGFRVPPAGPCGQAPCCAHGLCPPGPVLCPPSRGPMPRRPLSAPTAGSMRHEIPPWHRESGSYRSPPAASSSAAGARQPSASSQKEEAGAHHCSGRARDFGFRADPKCCGGIVIRRLF